MTKVLFVSNDPAIFDETSAVRARMRDYAVRLAAPSEASGEGRGELRIVSPAPRGAKESHEGPLHLYPVQTWKLLRMRRMARRAHALILEHGIEVVSAQDPFEEGIAALRAIEGTSAKLHVQVHTDFLSPWFTQSGNWRSAQVRMPVLNRMRLAYADEVLPKAAGIRVVSERVKQSLLAKYAGRIVAPVVIPVQVPSVVPPAVRLPAHPFTFALMCVGRLEPEKRIEDILEALALVVPKYPTIGLMIVGEGRERAQLEKLVQEKSLTKNVVFLGNRPDAWGLMRSAQAFIQASAYEGYGRTLLEAALAKVPIITTDVGIVGEVFKGYEDVLAVPVADPTALSLSIVGIVEDQGARVNLPIAAEAAARRHLAAQGDIPARIVADLTQVAGVI